MNLCSSKHEEVCYDGKDCPVCEAQEDTATAKSEIEDLKDKIMDLENDLTAERA